MIKIDFLADHLESIPTLVKWFRAQWPEYFADWSDEEMKQDFLSDTNRDTIPSRLVAFDNDELAGTIILRENGNESLAEYQPELGGLYVDKPYRGRGIGMELVRAGMKLAHDQGYDTVYATTTAAKGILVRLGWEFVNTADYQDGEHSLYRCKI